MPKLVLTPLQHVQIHCRVMGLPMPLDEFLFTKVRNWRFDIAWPDYKVALEIEGGAFTGGRHTSGVGFVKDMDKYNEAAIQGWCVIRCVPKAAKTERIKGLIYRALTRQINA